MLTSYDKYEPLETCNIPAWSTTWPADAGCSTRVLSYSARYLPQPDRQTGWYDPERVIEQVDNRHINGRNKSGPVPYRMTPRVVSRDVIRQFLVRRMYGGNGYNCFQQFGHTSKVGGSCVVTVDSFSSTGPKSTTYNAVTSRSDYAGTPYQVSAFDENEINDAMTSVENEASVAALTDYDFLTDLAEAREIPALALSITKDLIEVYKVLTGRFSWRDVKAASRIRPKDLIRHSKNAFRKIGDLWMEYRYGIMPLAYSYADINKLIKRGDDVTTIKSRVITPKPLTVTLPPATQQYLWRDEAGTVRVRAVVFQHFDWASMTLLSGLGLNPIATAWELIPYSFVFDWFCNMGDYIVRSTGSSLAQVVQACLSQHRIVYKNLWVHLPNQDITVTFSNVIPVNWYGANPPSTPSGKISRPEMSYLLEQEEIHSYSRSLFNVNAAKLTLNPSLNWRRGCDAVVMANNLLRTLTKKFFR